MSFRFRIGPFTFGKSGTRLSLWGRNGGVSIPISGKKKSTFGKIAFGPFRWFFGGSNSKQATNHNYETEINNNQLPMDYSEEEAIKSFGSDLNFIENIRNKGIPWRGVQERLKEEIPEHIIDRDEISYRLVPKAMTAVFGKQNYAWKTEKRSSKSGNGYTTWIVIIKT